jgi:F0F1-type ATP synthase membrane subunit b/b'
MVWFKDEMDYARENLKQASESAIERAGDKLGEVVKEGIGEASAELRNVILGASHEVDSKLDKISSELHDQRSFTKTDIKELVDYAADRLGATVDGRIAVMKAEITDLVQTKVEYFKSEVDSFFVQRQQDLARERRRLIANVLIAVSASFVVGLGSLMYQRYALGTINLFGVFRVVFAALAGGYGAYVLFNLIRRYVQMSEHKKDLLYLSMRYWGVLRPQSILSHLLTLSLIVMLFAMLFFPEQLAQFTGNQVLIHWVREIHGAK